MGAGVLRRAALNAFRLNSFRAAPPARTLSTGPKKPAAELTFKEAWLSDPATYPIVVIINRGHRLLQLLHLLPLLLAGRAHHQDGAISGDPGLDVMGAALV